MQWGYARVQGLECRPGIYGCTPAIITFSTATSVAPIYIQGPVLHQSIAQAPMLTFTEDGWLPMAAMICMPMQRNAPKAGELMIQDPFSVYDQEQANRGYRAQSTQELPWGRVWGLTALKDSPRTGMRTTSMPLRTVTPP